MQGWTEAEPSTLGRTATTRSERIRETRWAAAVTTGLSLDSRLAHRHLPGHRLITSESLGWTSVLVEVLDQPGAAVEFTTPPTADLLVVMGLQGQFRVESRSDGRWRSAMYRRGTMGVTSPGKSDTLRWQGADTGMRRTLHVHLASEAIEEAHAEMPPRTRARDLDDLDLTDPTAASILTALHTAMARKSNALVAETLAQALVMQLLSPRPHGDGSTRSSATLPTATLARVVDYVEAHLHDSITLDDLAREANLSKFHFLRAFRGTVGTTPHRYVMEMRMARAAALLVGEHRTVSTIAAMCGYSNVGRFTAAFREHHGVTPGAYRRS
jgi:AraC family transcriptional regulator